MYARISLAVLVVAACIAAYAFTAPEPVADGRLSVVATIFPLYDFARAVGGDKVSVRLLLPPGVEAHSFEPRPSEIAEITRSRVFIYAGAGMEPWAQDVLEGSKGSSTLVVEASSKVALLKEDGASADGGYDPHFWFDFGIDAKVVDAIAGAFSEKDPANAGYYLNNAANYKRRLSSLDSEYRAGLSGCRLKTFVVGGHNAFSYLARAYGLEVFSAYRISPDSEPTPQHVKELVDVLRRDGIKHVFFEELVNPRTAEAIAAEAGADTLTLNSAHEIPKAEFDAGATFLSLMQENLAALRQGLECG